MSYALVYKDVDSHESDEVTRKSCEPDLSVDEDKGAM